MSKIILAIFLIVLCGLIFVTVDARINNPCKTNRDCDKFNEYCETQGDENGNYAGMTCQDINLLV
ncbi:GSCOCT00009179001.2-RA-CDS [Cotesia congregata]|uniref:Venom peptide 80-5a n=1 Tax=Cotesia congregata TaxID=51543 RepID=A0A8J2H6L0_COTCN|nr:GSCOCT00009179001.2-RA-CDS [Cotesia congregata]CAG5078679.1 Putative venom peptide 80-5a [Cotesia congregata]